MRKSSPTAHPGVAFVVVRTPRTLAAVLLALVLATAARAQEAQTRFVEGLGLLANGNFERAAEAFGKAIDADSRVAVYHLDRAIALMLLDRGADAKQLLVRAAELEPQNRDAQVWTHARLLMFEPRVDAGPPPLQATSYAPTLIVACLSFGVSPDAGDRARSKAAIEQVARELARRQLGDGAAPTTAAKTTVDRVRELYEAKRYREVLAILDDLGARGPLDGVLLGYGAHSKLGLGDFQGARNDYTRALRTLPTVPGYLIGRARCELALGSLRDAQADLALAERVDSLVAAPSLAEAQRMLVAAKAKAGEAVIAAPHVREEQCTRERCRLELDARPAPLDVGKLVDLARFLLEPTAVCEVTLRGVATRARVPCGQPDLARAAEVLALAAKLDPSHPGCMTQSALLELARDRPDDMFAWVERALVAGVIDLDLAIANLDYCAKTANRLAAQAHELRETKYWEETRRVQDRWVEFPKYRFPTEAEKARAEALDAESKSLRARGPGPLQDVARRTAGRPAPEERVAHHLSTAFLHLWSGELRPALSSAQAALEADPNGVRALRFLIGACRQGGLADEAARYQQALDELAGH